MIGVDLNDDMLALARGAAPAVAQRVGYGNVEFRKGRIQDLGLDLEAMGGWLVTHPVTDVESLAGLEAEQQRLRIEQPLVPEDSGDVVVSNCVLNLVAPVDPATAPPFDCAPPTTVTAPGSASTARRNISGLITPGCQPASGCC